MLSEMWHRFLTRLSWQFTTFVLIAVILDAWFYLGFRHSVDSLLAVVAIEFAVATLYLDVRLHGRAEQIASAATTRYLGQSPGHLADLAKLMSDTHSNHEVLVLLDFFGHGHYSDAAAYETYFNAFKTAVQRQVKVRILVCDEEDVRAFTKAQFEKFDNGSPKFRKWIEYYESILQGYQPESLEDFIEALIYINDDFCHQLVAMHARGGSVRIRKMAARDEKETTSWMKEVIYIWLVRDSFSGRAREMIFSFPKFYGAQSGDCFQTRDSRLIESFQKRFEEKWNDGTTEITGHIYENCFKTVSAKIQESKKSNNANA